MTVLDALKQAVEQINGINVPIFLINQIGIPAQEAKTLIQASINALENEALHPPKEDSEAEEAVEAAPESETAAASGEKESADDDLFGEKDQPDERKAGEKHDEHADV